MKTELNIKSMTSVLTTFVAGLVYSDVDLSKISKQVKRGQKVSLFWERDNPYDRCAIKLSLNGQKIGYIPANKTSLLHSLRDRGVRFRAIVKTVAPTNATHRMVLIEVFCSASEDTENFINV